MRNVLALLLLTPLPLVAADDKKADLPPIPEIKIDRKEPIDYTKDIEPIFENKCKFCHSGNVIEGKFDMSTHAGVMKGGRRGVVVVPGKSTESLLYLFSSRQKKPIMPPKSEEPLTPEELALIKLWIDQGAKPGSGVREKPKIVVSLPPALVKPVRGVSINADKTLIAASRGNQIHLYEPTKGEHVKMLVDPAILTADKKPANAAHVSLVESLTFSPDGKTLVSGSFQEVILWDPASGAIKKRITGFADKVTTIAFSPDGRLFATGGGAPTEDGEIKVFETETGKEILNIRGGHSDTVFGVAFSPDGKMLATGGADKFVKVFEIPSGKFLKSFEGHTHHVLDVGWKPDGKFLVSAGADNGIKIWDFEKGEKARDVNGHSKQVTRLLVIPGKTPAFVTTSGDQQVKMWNFDNGGNMRNFAGNNDFLYALGVSTDGKLIAVGGEEGVVRLYNGENAQLIKALVPPGEESQPMPKK